MKASEKIGAYLNNQLAIASISQTALMIGAYLNKQAEACKLKRKTGLK